MLYPHSHPLHSTEPPFNTYALRISNNESLQSVFSSGLCCRSCAIQLEAHRLVKETSCHSTAYHPEGNMETTEIQVMSDIIKQ